MADTLADTGPDSSPGDLLGAGDMTVDLASSADGPAPPACQLLVYTTDAKNNGDFGGRAGLDNFCAVDINRPKGCSDVHALITVSASDSIATMPSTYGLDPAARLCWYNPASTAPTQFATSWTDMLDGTIAVSRGVGTGKKVYTWSGSGNSGQRVDAIRYHCTNWTQGTGPSSTTTGHWNYHYWVTANIGSGAVSMPDVTTDWLHTSSTLTKKQSFGPTTCCAFNAFACPTPCPPGSSATEYDDLTCGGEAHLMCICRPAP